MHREHLVIEIGIQHLAFGRGQLQTNEYGFETTHDEKEQCRCAIHQTEFLVVDREEP